jgi:hypothetical protein
VILAARRGRQGGHYVAVVTKDLSLLHAKIKKLPWRQIPTGVTPRETGQTETRSLKAVLIDQLRVNFAHARQAAKLTRWFQDSGTGKISRETAYVITSLTSAQASLAGLAGLVREHWPWRRITMSGKSPSVMIPLPTVTAYGPVNLATIPAAIIAAVKDGGYLHIPKAAATTPPPRRTSVRRGARGW